MKYILTLMFPIHESGLKQMIMMENSICNKWVKEPSKIEHMTAINCYKRRPCSIIHIDALVAQIENKI